MTPGDKFNADGSRSVVEPLLSPLVPSTPPRTLPSIMRNKRKKGMNIAKTMRVALLSPGVFIEYPP